MAIALRGTPTSVEATGTAGPVNNVPAGVVNGDVLIWRVSGTTATTGTTPSGWTAVVVTGSVATWMGIYIRVASAEPASYTFPAVTASRSVGIMSAYSGVHATTQQDVAATALNSGTTTTTSPAITPVTTGAWIVGYSCANVASAVVNTTASSGNTTVDSQKTSTSAAATNNVGATTHFAWTSGAFTPTYSFSNATVRTLGGALALRPAAVQPVQPPRNIHLPNPAIPASFIR